MQRPECHYPTVLDILNVEDPNVLNVLIDQLNVESVLLIESRSEASHVIVHQQPRGAKGAYTLEGDWVLQHAHYSNKMGKFNIIRESVEAAIREEESKLTELRASLVDLQRREHEMSIGIDKRRRYLSEISSKIRRKNEEKRRVKAAIAELENAQEEEEESEEDVATYVRF